MSNATKHECPACKGKGKYICETTTISVEGRTTSKDEMTCLWCRGRKTMDDEELAFYKACQNVWCKCGNPSGDVEYYEYENGSHGYNCADCGKLIQTG